MHLIISYLSTFSNYCKTILRIKKKKTCVSSILVLTLVLLGADSKQPLGADS